MRDDDFGFQQSRRRTSALTERLGLFVVAITGTVNLQDWQRTIYLFGDSA